MIEEFDIFISTHPFGSISGKQLQLLKSSGYSFELNGLGRKMTPGELADKALHASVLVAGTEDLRPLLDVSEKLACISRVGVGLDSVPLSLCKDKGIKVCYTPDAVTMAVVELTIGLALSGLRSISRSDRDIRGGGWNRYMGTRIEGSSVGIVGCGRIGSKVCQLLSAFSPDQLLVCDIEDRESVVDTLQQTGVSAHQVDFQEITAHSDILSLHVPLTSETRAMVGEAQFREMRSNALLINTSRGGIVDEIALLSALESGEIGGAAIDVFETEPYTGKLVHLDNLIMTAHMGSCSSDCRERMETEAVLAALSFLKGEELPGEVPETEYKYQLD